MLVACRLAGLRLRVTHADLNALAQFERTQGSSGRSGQRRICACLSRTNVGQGLNGRLGALG